MCWGTLTPPLETDMTFRRTVGRYTPAPLKRYLSQRFPAPPSPGRRESNRWLRSQACGITGRILSIGSGNDSDGEGGRYRSYFAAADSYTTSEISADFGADMVLDVRSMPQIADASIDCVFCNGVLEHVDDDLAALREMHRIIRPDGILLIGLPFNQPIHLAPTDFRRYTEYGIRYLLEPQFEILALDAICDARFPTAYWVKARKRQAS
jgi:SAM-dependent methyltransferase